MTHTIVRKTAIACLLTLTVLVYGGSPALAQSSAMMMQYEGTTYATGGVGAEEQAQFEALGSEFNLRLTMARPDGSYLSDVRVMVHDSQGNTVLEATTTGPFFYAQLPPGQYTVVASLEGRAQENTVELTAGEPTKLKLTW